MLNVLLFLLLFGIVWYVPPMLFLHFDSIIDFLDEHPKLRKFLANPLLWFLPAIILNISAHALTVNIQKTLVFIFFSVGTWLSATHYQNAKFNVLKDNYEEVVKEQNELIAVLMKTTPEKELKKAYHSNS